jgi:hypothetical protein
MPPKEEPDRLIYFIVIDHHNQVISRKSAELAVMNNTTVDNLSEMIKKKKKNLLGHLDSDDLEIWKYNHVNLNMTTSIRDLKVIVSSIEFSDESENPELLPPGQTMMQINLPQNGVFIVRIPSPQTANTAGGNGGECLICLAPTQHV